jgi:hypothetical protein
MLILAVWCIAETLTLANTPIAWTMALFVLVIYETTKLNNSRCQSVEYWYYVEAKVEEEHE